MIKLNCLPSWISILAELSEYLQVSLNPEIIQNTIKQHILIQNSDLNHISQVTKRNKIKLNKTRNETKQNNTNRQTDQTPNLGKRSIKSAWLP